MGNHNPWGVPVFVVIHRADEEPPGAEFILADGVVEAIERGATPAVDKRVQVVGGADVIRQALEAKLVDQLSIIVAPLIPGGASVSSKASANRSSWSTWEFGRPDSPRSSTTGSCDSPHHASAGGGPRLDPSGPKSST